ncbi:MAG TPA: HNH endonuclease [Anaerolineae bacterium]|nr:HNH endonuclease [Anaerolineae bacterium]
MKIRLSGRTKESNAAIEELADFLEKFGEVKEIQESILVVDAREAVLVAFSAQAYYERKGYYWFSLAKTKYASMLKWSEDHAWMVLICGTHGRYFVPFSLIKPLLNKMPSNRRDGRWDIYVRFEGENAYFGVTEIKNHLDVTRQLHHFEQIWERPSVEEVYVDEAIYIPDSLPTPDQRTGKILRVVRDTTQSKVVKELYSYKCQICGWTTHSPRLKSLWYCEAHHIQPLGMKYRGPDHVSNIIALCPTHHCMMDLGVMAIEPSKLTVLSINEQEPSRGQKLTLRREHGLNQKYLRFHLDNIYVRDYRSREIRLSRSDQGI